jgi:hypothetical protein
VPRGQEALARVFVATHLRPAKQHFRLERSIECILALLVYEAGVRACCEEDPRDIEVAHPARTQESRVAIVVYHVHARAVLQQECHHVRVALLTRAVKRWEVH